jgi:hypothetical protein
MFAHKVQYILWSVMHTLEHVFCIHSVSCRAPNFAALATADFAYWLNQLCTENNLRL